MVRAITRQENMRTVERVKIGDLHLDRLDMNGLMDEIIEKLEKRESCHVATVNLQFLGVASKDARFAEMVNGADLVVADGMPLVRLSKLMGEPIPERITGHDLLHQCAALAVTKGYSVAFLGAEPDVADKATHRLRKMYPGLMIKGIFGGQFSPEGYLPSEQDEEALIEDINRLHPDILFVALGCPKQEYWISNHIHDIDVPVCIGVGGVLDVMADNLKRAPRWLQSMGLEWAYRLHQEPGRLWKRYLLGDVPRIFRLIGYTLFRRASA